MKIILETNKKIDCNLANLNIKKIIIETITMSKLDFSNRIVSLSLALVDNDEIREINKTWRKKDKETDVLSFADLEWRDGVKKNNEFFLGELIMCCNYIEKSARIRNTNYQWELASALTHGVLHLLGFSHGRKMFEIQDAVAGQFSQKNN